MGDNSSSWGYRAVLATDALAVDFVWRSAILHDLRCGAQPVGHLHGHGCGSDATDQTRAAPYLEREHDRWCGQEHVAARAVHLPSFTGDHLRGVRVGEASHPGPQRTTLDEDEVVWPEVGADDDVDSGFARGWVDGLSEPEAWDGEPGGSTAGQVAGTPACPWPGDCGFTEAQRQDWQTAERQLLLPVPSARAARAPRGARRVPPQAAASAAAAPPASEVFVPAEAFAGPRAGWFFGTGDMGTGLPPGSALRAAPGARRPGEVGARS